MSFLRGALHPSDAVKECLLKAGVKTPVDFLLADLEALASQGCSYRELEALRKVLYAQHAARPVRGDVLYRDAFRNSVVFSTANPRVDAVLEGGILRGEVVEVFGKPGTGKTSFCSRMAVRQAVCGRRVLYVDTGAALTPPAVLEHLEAMGEEVKEEILGRLSVCCPADVWSLIGTVADALTSEAAPQLFILDAVTVFMLASSSSTQDMGAMWQLSSELRTLASKRNTAVLLVMHYSDLPPGNVLYRMWQHLPHIRMEFQTDRIKHTRTEGIFRIVKATRLPVNQEFTPL
ncbi:DNA recombination and repair protein Rad51-like C-terminal [Trinorchestia longiramus]|nr:DNA recombination and repair protein Rad51-like C-terminal [Trinorchestia longiramus]